MTKKTVRTKQKTVSKKNGPTRISGRHSGQKSGNKKGDAVTVGKKVLNTEIEGLTELSASLGKDLEDAVSRLLAIDGRVLVSGIGKSGHIARKVAATLASTGTPAHFVHPSEASHGDLGMITSRDAVLMMSNSGASPELADIITHCRRNNILLIGISAGAQSALMDHADIRLLIPSSREACPMGLAPTTSTTQMMALGDVIAVALMERRGFTSADYRDLHPGGALGKALLRVSDIMHTGKEMPLVKEAMMMSDVLLVMTAKSFGCAGVVDTNGRLTGIITDGDLRRHMSDSLVKKKAKTIMTPRPKLLRKGMLVAEAVYNFNTSGILCAFVVSDTASLKGAQKPVGFLHMHDCLRAGIS